MTEIRKLPEETEEQFLWRIGQKVDSGEIESWQSINNIVNTELGIEEEKWRDESSFRKRYQAAKNFYNGCFSKMENNDFQEEIDKLNRELARNTVKFRDQRNAWSKQNYIDARVEETMDLLEEKLKEISRIEFPAHITPIINGEEEMIICLSDLHIGQTFSSVFGEYNSSIAEKRLGQYLESVKEYAKTFNIKKCHILSLGDQISGNIHLSIQVTNRENVNEQIKRATELISSFCYKCSKIFEVVQFYNVSGNHTRLTKKDDAIHEERIDDIIGWAVSLSMTNVENFHYMKHRNLDIGICDISACGRVYIGCHGDYDAMTKQGVANLSMMLGFVPDGIFRGHMHYPAYNELNGVKVIQSGSLAGSGDSHTIECRLTGKPTQTICICDKKGIKLHIPVTLD